MTEEWREISEFAGYMVSNIGRIKSPKRGILKGHTVQRSGKATSIVVTFKIDGKLFSRAIHRLVLQAFVGPCPDGMEGCHSDGDGTNNTIGNLRWDTHAANMRDAINHGTFIRGPGFQRGNRIGRGSRNSKANLNEAQVLEIKKKLASGIRQADVARSFGVTKHTIAHIALGRSWKWLGG